MEQNISALPRTQALFSLPPCGLGTRLISAILCKQGRIKLPKAVAYLCDKSESQVLDAMALYLVKLLHQTGCWFAEEL